MVSAKSPRQRLAHILEQVDQLVAATDKMSDDQIIASYMTRRAIERAIEIVSESRKIPA